MEAFVFASSEIYYSKQQGPSTCQERQAKTRKWASRFTNSDLRSLFRGNQTRQGREKHISSPPIFAVNTNLISHTVDGRNPVPAKKPWLKPLFVGISRVINSLCWVLSWCEMDFATIHSISLGVNCKRFALPASAQPSLIPEAGSRQVRQAGLAWLGWATG